MSWLSDLVGPKLREIVGSDREETAADGGVCPRCGAESSGGELCDSLWVCPACGHHFPLGAEERLAMLFDDAVYHPIQLPVPPSDPLRFRDVRRYSDRLKDAQAKTGHADALVVAHGKLGGTQVVAAVLDQAFLEGSIGLAFGAGLSTAARLARVQRAPLLIFACPTFSRLNEGLFSVSQLSRIAIAVQDLRSEHALGIVVLTHGPGGVLGEAIASLGDITVVEDGRGNDVSKTADEGEPGATEPGTAEPGAAETAGTGDLVIHRHDLRDMLVRLVGLSHRRRPLASVLPLRAGASSRPNGTAHEPVAHEPAANLDGTRDAPEH